MKNNNNDEPIEIQLIKAAGTGDVRAVRELIEAGACIHVNDGEPLRMAAWCNHTAVLETLIEAGADVHAYGGLALRWALASGHSEAATLLRLAMRSKH